MNNEVTLMNFEQFFRGKCNAHSERAPKSIREAIQDPNLPDEIKLHYGGTLKHRLDSLDDFSKGVMLGCADESFSIKPISEEQENHIEEYTRQFYENMGYRFDKKDSCGLSDTYFFINNSKDVMVVTCTLPWDNERDGLLVSTTKVRSQ